MNYGAIKYYFQRRFKRTDISSGDIDTYMGIAMQRIQRLANVPAMEQIGIYTVDENYDDVPIPGDFLKHVSMTVNGGVDLQRVDLSTVNRYLTNGSTGTPAYFTRDADKYIIVPTPNVGDEIRLVYNADFNNLVNDSDTNWMSEVAPDVLISGALVEACDDFVDPRRDTYEQKFLEGIASINSQAQADVLAGAKIGPTYDMDSQYDGEW